MMMQKNMERIFLSVILPAYNEEEGIGNVLDELLEVMAKIQLSYEIFVIDDGSEDSTSKIVEKRESVKLLRHDRNRGYGTAIKTGIRASNGERILIMDADGTYPAGDILKLLEYSDEYDMVVGARIGENINISLVRKLGKCILSKFANYLASSQIPDLNSGLRMFKREIAQRFFHLFPDGFSFTTTITLASLVNGYQIKFVPIDYHTRKGKSKIKLFRDGFNFLLLIARIVAYFNPLKVFLPLSILILFLGIAIALYVYFVYGIILDTTIALVFITSIQTAVLGLLADLIVKRSNREFAYE